MRWKSIYYVGWQKRFALTPVTLDDGTTVWLESYDQSYSTDRSEIEKRFGRDTRAVGFWMRRKGMPRPPVRLAQVERP